MDRELDVGSGDAARRVSVIARAGQAPALVWFGGFRSDMRATKAEALDGWAVAHGRALVRFDYSGHGRSGGRFEDGTISRWLEESLAVIDAHVDGRAVLVGSSMGAWIALLAALRLDEMSRRPAGLVLLAPAIDFTERLMWNAFPAEARQTLMATGVYHRPSLYGEEPYPITRALIEDGRRHLLLHATSPISLGCPVHILQGMRDPDVPWEHAMRLVERLPADSVQITLVKDGDHRLSRPEDLDRLMRAVEAISSG